MYIVHMQAFVRYMREERRVFVRLVVWDTTNVNARYSKSSIIEQQIQLSRVLVGYSVCRQTYSSMNIRSAIEGGPLQRYGE